MREVLTWVCEKCHKSFYSENECKIHEMEECDIPLKGKVTIISSKDINGHEIDLYYIDDFDVCSILDDLKGKNIEIKILKE